MHKPRLLMGMFLLPLLFLFASHSTRVMAQSGPEPAKEKSLYERVGGYDALASVVDEFMKRLAADKQLARFLVGLSDDSKKRLRQHLLNQFCQATGGPCVYTGREMKTVHTGLKITESDWDIAAKALVETLDKFQVPKKEKDEIVNFVVGLKKDIVGL
ncbi:MAG TPA: group 1 truncated hemoglobin [Pyrinomonadaceae bacterium]|nr:group 1 truncated hemoglobin [Pyrinomonadaceae bacterium]